MGIVEKLLKEEDLIHQKGSLQPSIYNQNNNDASFSVLWAMGKVQTSWWQCDSVFLK